MRSHESIFPRALSSGTAGRSFRKFCFERNTGSSRRYGIGLIVYACGWMVWICVCPGRNGELVLYFWLRYFASHPPLLLGGIPKWDFRGGISKSSSRILLYDRLLNYDMYSVQCAVCSVQCAVIARLLLSCPVLSCASTIPVRSLCGTANDVYCPMPKWPIKGGGRKTEKK